MIAILSPSKTMEAMPQRPPLATYPPFKAETEELVGLLKTFSVSQLQALMGISPSLARLNADRYAGWQWSTDSQETAPALFLFKGDVYEGLDAGTLDKKALDFAQTHLRILSGLYGWLRPFDHILPYRLEMGTKLQVGRHKDLYHFWEDKIHISLQAELDASPEPLLINLASNEYAKALLPKKLKVKTITPSFLENKNDRYTMISFFAKKARGMMARFILQERITRAEELKAFNEDGYQFNPRLSSEEQLAFTRG